MLASNDSNTVQLCPFDETVAFDWYVHADGVPEFVDMGFAECGWLMEGV